MVSNDPLIAAFLAELLRVAVVTVQPPPDPKKPATEKQYVDAHLRLKDVDVKELFSRLKIDIPLKLEARASADITLSIPLTAARNTKAYKAKGTITAPRLTVEGLDLDDVVAELSLDDGVLTLGKLTAKPRADKGEPGTLEGKARLEIEPRGDLTASLTLTDVPLAKALSSFPGLKLGGTGRVSGDAKFQAPVDKVGDLGTWVASANLRGDKIDLQGRRIDDLRLDAKIARGSLELTTAKAKVEGIPITATGTLGLAEPYRLSATVKTAAQDVFALRRLLPELELPVEISGKLESDTEVKGTLSPFAVSATGKASITDAKIADSEVKKASFRWSFNDQHLLLTDVEAKVYDGTITGKADIPLDDKAKGDFLVNFKGVDAAALTKAIPDAPVAIEGAVDGKLSGTLPAVEKGKSRQATADLDLTAPKLTLQGIPTERVSGKLRYNATAIEYEIKGDALGGGFDLEGKYPLGTSKQGTRRPDADPFHLGDLAPVQPEYALLQPKPAGSGSFHLRGAELSRLARALKSTGLEPLRGRVDVTLDYTHDDKGSTTGKGRVSIRRLGWGTATLAEQLTAALVLDDDRLELADVSGLLANGTVRGRARYNRAVPARSFFNVTVENADPKLLLAPWPDLTGVIRGATSVQLRGRVGRAWRGTGLIAVARGEVGGIEAADLRVPFDWAFAPGRGGEITAREPTGRFVGGQVQGHAVYEWWPGGNRVDGDLRFGNVDLAVLDVTQLTGRVRGRFTFAGTNVTSVNDLTGLLTATLGEVSSKQNPVVQRVLPYLGSGQSIMPFRSGEVRARLARGSFRVERLDLLSDGAKVFAEGTVTLGGRLDLLVLANTGRVGPDPRVIRLIARRIPAIGPVPVAALAELSDLLSNRLVRLSVTGTVQQPVVRINTAALLSDEAARFFTQRVRERVLSPDTLLLP